MIQPQSVELCSLGTGVDTIQVVDTLKHKDFQFIMDKNIPLNSKLNSIKGEKVLCLR